MNNQCQICYEYLTYLTECRCPICAPCLQIYYQGLLNEKQLTLSHFKCLICRQQQSVDILKKLNLEQEFEQYAFEHNCIEGLNEDEVLIDCLGCPNKYVIKKDALIQNCHACKQTYCRKCFKEYRPGCCQQAIHGQCPKCHVSIYRDQGCNYLTCRSSKCKGQTHFCAICFIVLNKNSHYTHYLNNNPYLNCKPIQANPFKCYKCQTLNPLKSQCLDDQISYCTSDICKGQLYCRYCGPCEKNHQCKRCRIF